MVDMFLFSPFLGGISSVRKFPIVLSNCEEVSFCRCFVINALSDTILGHLR